MPGINFSAYRIHFLCCWPYEFGPLDSNFARFCFILPLQISLISWPIGRPPAERRGVQGGDPPAKAKRLLLRYCKKKVTSYDCKLGFPWGSLGINWRYLGEYVGEYSQNDWGNTQGILGGILGEYSRNTWRNTAKYLGNIQGILWGILGEY